MQFLFSGEGPTDLGVCSSDVNMCCGRDFLHGPWAMIVDQLVERRQEYSPHSLKKEVERHFGHRPSREQLCQMVTDGQIDALRIDMPSFRAFTDRLATLTFQNMSHMSQVLCAMAERSYVGWTFMSVAWP